MKMKKLAAIIFSAAMVLNMGAAAMAEGSITVGDKTYSDSTTVTIGKVYKLVGDGASPKETFTLTQTGSAVKDGDAEVAPALGTITGATYEVGAASADGANGEITVELPTYEKVGIYEYTLEETDNKTAGVTYRTAPIKLVVTVMEGDDGQVRVAAVHTESEGKKQGTFDNTYSAGKLEVTKKVTGNLGDKSKYFDVTVTVTNPADKVAPNSYAVSGGSNSANPSTIAAGTATTFKLKADETITIANMPYGVTYTVKEADYTGDNGGYDPASYNGSDGTDGAGIVNSASEKVEITNNKGATVDTGINLDSMPYIMILALVAVCAVVMFARKRFSANR